MGVCQSNSIHAIPSSSGFSKEQADALVEKTWRENNSPSRRDSRRPSSFGGRLDGNLESLPPISQDGSKPGQEDEDCFEDEDEAVLEQLSGLGVL